ncbi:hypothetical protein DL546_002100 [Coniochaeta pulveracea]|uniref:DNA replication factor Cdt1 C-terminal domain-containing protein n=1 Tax=Coniochaeta pulveracea TaxID=177199 RepID=A0A420YF66_9PEZI|nr:hypothetical protein DL546_002100 [Coniochaeta pulveracea]
MPAAISRRRGQVAMAPKPPSTSITNFARVCKVQATGKDILAKAAVVESGKPTTIEIVLTSKKRKAEAASPLQESSPLGPSKRQRQEVFLVPTTQAPLFAALKKKKAATTTHILDDKENAAPAARQQLLSPAKIRAPPNTSTTTKVHQKRRRSSDASEAEPVDLLERLALASPVRTRILKRTRVAGTVEQLPQELLDLLGLQASFLKALTLHYAHNGTNAPVDIDAICPNVSASWGKRKVTSEDIQRCVGMTTFKTEKGKAVPTASPFLLVEYKRTARAALATSYARGKLCIELSQEAASGRLDEQELNKTFEENLRMLWSTRRDSNINSFIGCLPRASVTTRNAAVPMLVKGQVAREAMQMDLVKRQQEKEAKTVSTPTTNTDGSKMSLLDRIRQKEVQASQAAPGPSPAQLQRRAALQRAEDVAGVIGMLTMATSEGRARISFTMPQLLIKLKDSLRVPVSAEDGASCVRLIAKEVAPEWLKIVTIGGRENVVVQTTMQAAKTEVQARVSRLLA